jgi:hypothetical protein
VGGTTVTLTGSGFIAGNVVVEFGGVLATSVQFVNSTTVTAVAPAGAAGTTDVLVANSDGQSSDLAAAYTYQAAAAPPALTGISPASGLLGGATLVTLTGSNFISGITVSFGSLSASSVNFSNSALITAVTPAAAAGAVNVTVTNPDAQTSTLTNGFTYMAPPPALWGVSPTNGVPGGGTLVTLTGSNFVSGITVSFGLLAASSVNFSNSTLITAVAPAAAAGAVNVTVTNPDTQTSTLMNGFTYAVAAPPPQPTISMATMSGANLVLVLAGSTNASCRVLTSTNPASAVAYWMPVATNAVGAGGLFTNTIPITQAERQRYFLISIP